MWTRVLSKVKNLTPTKGGSKKKGGIYGEVFFPAPGWPFA